jgi:hypothetical protein
VNDDPDSVLGDDESNAITMLSSDEEGPEETFVFDKPVDSNSSKAQLDRLMNGPSSLQRVFKQTGVRVKDLQFLRPQIWINDQIINLFLKLVPVPEHSVVLSSLFPRPRLIPKFITGKRFIFVPINLHNTHWVFAVVDRQQKEIRGYDSFHRDINLNLRIVLRKLGVTDSEVAADWTFYETPPTYPKQTDWYSCGVFTAIGLWFLLTGRTIDYTQEDLHRFGRDFIGRSILEHAVRKDLRASLLPGNTTIPAIRTSVAAQSDSNSGTARDDSDTEDPAIAATTPDTAAPEAIEAFEGECKPAHLDLVRMPGDGHCLFYAMAFCEASADGRVTKKKYTPNQKVRHVRATRYLKDRQKTLRKALATCYQHLVKSLDSDEKVQPLNLTPREIFERNGNDDTPWQDVGLDPKQGLDRFIPAYIRHTRSGKNVNGGNMYGSLLDAVLLARILQIDLTIVSCNPKNEFLTQNYNHYNREAVRGRGYLFWHQGHHFDVIKFVRRRKT